jgi:hydrogenase-1 operon protein HyaF
MISLGVAPAFDRGLVAPRGGNAKALLRELLRLLEGLASGGEGGSIDLRSVPLTDADKQELHDVLGSGAIDARIDALGESRVRETRFPGIWWVTHCNEAGATVAELIEVEDVPTILRACKQDVVDATEQLRHALDAAARIGN